MEKLYPENKAKEIAELAKVGTDNNLNFCWTIHQGDTTDKGDSNTESGGTNNKPIPDTGRNNLGFMAGAIGFILAGISVLKKRG